MAKFPTVRTPTIDEVLDIADDFGLNLSIEDAESYQGLMAGTVASYDRLDDLAEPKLEVKYPRTTGYRPPPEENPYNAWYWKSKVKGKTRGLLSGKTIVLKDNICLAGVPMMNGSMVLEGFVPDVDATVVTRILDAGGTIIGKAANTNLCFDGGSATTATGMVENPHKRGYSAGGSSAGSAVLVAIGEADMGMGGDQGGSIRIPACWSGIVGHKPTHGLVPYTGVFPIEMTLDHTGPMTKNVTDAALLLQAIAGSDGQDPRQIDCRTQDYVKALSKGVNGMKIAILKEGFGHPESEKIVDQKVRSAARSFKSLGAIVKEVSIPIHLDGFHIWNAIAVEGATELMLKGNGFGTNWEGYYTTSLLDAYAKGWRSRPNDLSETVKTVMMLGEYMHRNYNGHYYAKAQNLSRKLRNSYDEILEDFDVIVLPTLPQTATKLPAPDCSREEYVDSALNMLRNTAPFDCSGHPAISIPCGFSSSGLPIGMMIVGKRYDDATVLQAARAFEKKAKVKKKK
ncbi:MAG: Asp-tRNA(Asn)/Glu-tRNA(Gln) amidotransferase GatCAB subunit A [Alphaproteobacteria bacterium]|nr:Asp-tRNA(Asn)/Glu-tRNA(Gln) amidotransferase GatCAB subunit A [Alphaproteobacteria bacterium]|tara:strand:- start:6666 stop:8201 length:1536 start_codon:yes stop_codon:yes gene_type:complete